MPLSRNCAALCIDSEGQAVTGEHVRALHVTEVRR